MLCWSLALSLDKTATAILHIHPNKVMPIQNTLVNTAWESLMRFKYFVICIANEKATLNKQLKADRLVSVRRSVSYRRALQLESA